MQPGGLAPNHMQSSDPGTLLQPEHLRRFRCARSLSVSLSTAAAAAAAAASTSWPERQMYSESIQQPRQLHLWLTMHVRHFGVLPRVHLPAAVPSASAASAATAESAIAAATTAEPTVAAATSEPAAG